MSYVLQLATGATFALGEDYETAVALLGEMLGDVVVGHPGDLLDGGDRTLVWECEADAQNDSGRNAVGAILLRRSR